MKKFRKLIFYLMEVIVIFTVVMLALEFATDTTNVLTNDTPFKYVWNNAFSLSATSLLIFITVAMIMGAVNLSQGSNNLNNTKSVKAGDNQHGSSRFATQEEKRTYYKLVNRKSPDTLGFVIGYDKHNNFYVDDSDKNILVYAPPGSGKTKSLLINNIMYALDVYEHTEKWSNQVIVSLKNDLHDMTIERMRKSNVNINVINLRSPLMSDRFNPMKQVNDWIDKYNCTEIKTEQVKAYAKAEKYAKTLAAAIVKAVDDTQASGGDQFFKSTAQGLISAIILLVAEFGEGSERQLISVFKLIIELNGLTEDSTDTQQKSRLKELLEKKPDHRANLLAGASISADNRTSMNVFSSALSELLSFMDLEIEQMFQSDDGELDLHNYVTNRSVVYLIIPDEDTTKHFIGSLFYRLLFDMAIATAENEFGGKLPYNIMNHHDEFGQFPAIKDYDGIVQAVRSRGIKNITYLQNFEQMKNRYGEVKAKNIIASYQIMMNAALPPGDDDWRKSMSERLGKETVQTSSVNYGTSGRNYVPTSNQNRGTTKSLVGRELLTPDELTRLPVGTWIVVETGKYPMKMQMKLATDLWKIKEINNFEEKPINDIEILKLEKLDSIFRQGNQAKEMSEMYEIFHQSEIEEHQYYPEMIEVETNNYNENYEKLINFLNDHEVNYDKEKVKELTLDSSMKADLNNYFWKIDDLAIPLKRELSKIIKGF
ncbi:MAG: type IV secretory system conjugative DNA transfer family protein [Bacilli bacterium]